MKLYELRSVLSSEKGLTHKNTRFLTSQTQARMVFSKARRSKEVLTLTLYAVQVDTRLTTQDWIALLESDAPGMVCNMTPIDRIADRELLLEWTR